MLAFFLLPTWLDRYSRSRRVPLVSFHAEFLPHDPTDPEHPKLVNRLRNLVHYLRIKM
jgi:hypothetical protein